MFSRVISIAIDIALEVFATTMFACLTFESLPWAQRGGSVVLGVVALWWLAWRFAASRAAGEDAMAMTTAWHYGLDGVLIVLAAWLASHVPASEGWPSVSQTMGAALSVAAVPLALLITRFRLPAMPPSEGAFRMADPDVVRVLLGIVTVSGGVAGASVVVARLGSAWFGS